MAPPAVVEESGPQTTETEETEDKLTEYEIFQKLQMKEQKADRKRVSIQLYSHQFMQQCSPGRMLRVRPTYSN